MERVRASSRPSPQPSLRGRGGNGITRFAFLLLSSLIPPPSSLAQTTQPTLSINIGFDGVFKPDSWTPVFVTVAESSSHPGTIEVRSARGRMGNVISARVQSNPKPTTFTLYAQLDPLDRATVEWRDDAGKLVSGIDVTEMVRQNPAALGGPVIGVAGAIADANRVAGQIVRDTGEFVASGTIRTRLLPERATAYQSLDVLVLPELNTDEIDDATEAEIVRWMNAGGMVITWPGTQAPPEGSPLGRVLAASVGDVVTRSINGKEVAVRSLTAADANAVDLSDSDTILFTRKVGLGQIAVFGFDPTRVYGSIDRRIAALRQATASQVSMSPDERRVGSYDPLVYQARGEEQLPTPAAPNDQWLLLALAFGLIMGPGESLLLLFCRRPIFTPLTMVGFAVALGSGVAISIKSVETHEASIEVVVENDSGVVARSILSSRVPESAAASWVIGRSSDPQHETAGELSVGQRQDHLESGTLIALSDRLPRVRSFDYQPAKPLLLVSGSITDSAAQMQSSDASAWEKAFVISADSVRALAKAPPADQALSVPNYLQPATDSDDPATARRETGIEALAKQPGWEAILMDRQLGSRIVRLFEKESVSAIVASRTHGSTRQFVIHLQRP